MTAVPGEDTCRLLFENNPHPMWVYDLETLAFLAVNEAAREKYGYSRAEFLAMTLKDIRPAEDVQRLLDDVAQQRPSLQHSGLWRHRLRDGRVIDVEITSHTLNWQNRRAALVVAQDVTARRQAEAEIRQLTAELEQRVARRTAQLHAANRELEAFAYSVSHDLRAPLRAIDGFSRMLLEDHAGALDAEGQRLLGVVRANTRKMDALITDLLALSRVGRTDLQMSPIDMAALAQAALDEAASPEVQRDFEFSMAALPTALGDPTLIRQVWSNLIANAIKFTRPQAQPRIEIGGRSEQDWNVYFVKDNGVGFDPLYAHKLFETFQRLHAAESFEGTGVGLAIVQRIIERHGGQVWAEGEPNAGAAFYFTLAQAGA